jgi:hypothetical protein
MAELALGKTFVHVADEAPAAARPPGIELSTMVPQDIEEIAKSDDPQLRRISNSRSGAVIKNVRS